MGNEGDSAVLDLPQAVQFLIRRVKCFSLADAKRVKAIEATTRHDVKAVEYFLKELLQQANEVSLLKSRATNFSLSLSLSFAPI